MAQVTLVVSDGEETLPVTVISFLEMTEEDARTAATNLGLDPVFEGSEYSSEYDEGDVCWQSITNGTQVAEGTTIRFRVSLGPDPAATPSPSVEPSPEATPAPTPDDGEETPSCSPSPSRSTGAAPRRSGCISTGSWPKPPPMTLTEIWKASF